MGKKILMHGRHICWPHTYLNINGEPVKAQAHPYAETITGR